MNNVLLTGRRHATRTGISQGFPRQDRRFSRLARHLSDEGFQHGTRRLVPPLHDAHITDYQQAGLVPG